MQPLITFADACLDPNLFGDWFAGETWANWRVIDRAMFGEPLSAAELAVFQELTGRDTAPTETAKEIWLIVGRRGGKDVKSAALATYLATIGVERYGWKARLVGGERGVVQLLAVDRDQAKVAFRYISSMFEKPLLAQMVDRDTADTIELKNGFAIEVTTSDQRRVRGRTVVAAIFDEVAFWKSENTNSPDIDVYRAVKPAMATMPGAMIIGISSPYARKGLLWRQFQRYFAKAGSVLVVKAATWVMNPTVDRASETILEAYDEDPEAARAEYGAEFRDDISAFVPRDAVEACIEGGVRERPPQRQYRYVGFVDPSGGSADSMTMAVAHKEGDTAILDVLREIRPPFSPEAVCAEFAEVLKQYRLSQVTGDKYAGEWVREPFRRNGVFYQANAAPKSDLYRDLLPLINSRAVDLLENDRMVNQLCALERKTGRSGKDSIDHPPNAHDDVANAVAGALTLAMKQSGARTDIESERSFKPRCVV